MGQAGWGVHCHLQLRAPSHVISRIPGAAASGQRLTCDLALVTYTIQITHGPCHGSHSRQPGALHTEHIAHGPCHGSHGRQPGALHVP